MPKNSISKIHFGNLVDRSYFTYLFLIFIFVSIFLTYILIRVNDSNELILIKFISIIFLLMLISVLFEMPRKSEYISLVDSIDLRHFFRDFIRDNGVNYANKYDSITQKRIKEIFEKGNRFQISYIIKKNGVFEITFYRDISNKNFIFGFLLGFRLHKLYIKDLGQEYQIVRLK